MNYKISVLISVLIILMALVLIGLFSYQFRFKKGEVSVDVEPERDEFPPAEESTTWTRATPELRGFAKGDLLIICYDSCEKTFESFENPPDAEEILSRNFTKFNFVKLIRNVLHKVHEVELREIIC